MADASLDALLHRSEDLAKGWLLALLEQAPLDDAPRIPAAKLARDGPRVCEALLRAIGSDADERRLEPDGALAPLAARVGELAGAAGARDTAQAVDALQSVLWAALRAELRDPDPELISDLAARLAQVSALLRSAALPHGETGASGLDEGSPVSAVPEAGGSPVSEPRLRAWMGDQPLAPEPPALWVGALREEIQRAGSAPLSLLLAELEDADRVLAVEPEPAATFSEFTHGLRRAMRRQDILVCEASSRAWVIARDTGRAGARSLSERIVSAVREGRPWRGAPLVASVGFAVLGEDGRTPAELIEAAEEARFAAASRGAL